MTILTYHTTDIETTKSFKIHVRVAGEPATEMVLEADLHDAIVQRLDYHYDHQNQLVRRTHDDDGPYEANVPTDRFFSYQEGQIVLQFDGPEEEAALSHRYFWNPTAIDQLLADEVVTDLEEEGEVLWTLTDHLGTIRDIATHDTTTTIANHRRYDSFGNHTARSTATAKR